MEFEQTQTVGLLSIEQDLKAGSKIAGIGIQVAEDGRIWVCVDGVALIRFKPLLDKEGKY